MSCGVSVCETTAWHEQIGLVDLAGFDSDREYRLSFVHVVCGWNGRSQPLRLGSKESYALQPLYQRQCQCEWREAGNRSDNHFINKVKRILKSSFPRTCQALDGLLSAGIIYYYKRNRDMWIHKSLYRLGYIGARIVKS